MLILPDPNVDTGINWHEQHSSGSARTIASREQEVIRNLEKVNISLRAGQLWSKKKK